MAKEVTHPEFEVGSQWRDQFDGDAVVTVIRPGMMGMPEVESVDGSVYFADPDGLAPAEPTSELDSGKNG